MSHNVHTPHLRRVRPLKLAVIAVSALAFVLSAASAHADAVRCKREIAKASAKYAQARMRSLQKCQDGKLTGKVSGTCPDAKTSEALSKAAGKLRSAIDKKCGGVDKDCTSAGDNDSLASISWPSACPNFEGGTCNNSISNCDGVSNCLLCVDDAAVDQGIALYYGSLVNSSNTTIKKCQREIGKNAVKYLRMKSKLLQKCKDKVLSGQSAGPCPDPKTATVLGMAEAKRNAKICSACGGDDRVCGGSDDLAPTTIGFPSNCTDVTVPGGADCSGPVSTLQQLVTCVGCVTNYKSECVDRVAAPSMGAYPSDCSSGAVPPTCGDNVVDPGEDCDGTSDAACPGNCTGSCRCAGPCVLPSEIPTTVAFIGRPGSELDTGWTGIGHDSQTADNAALMAGTVSNCDLDTGSPTCGRCDLSGPVAFPGPAKNCVCSNLATPDSSSLAVCNPQAPSCSGGETCSCLLGPPLPISAGAVPVCVVSRLTGAVSGTANISDSGPHAGEGSVQLQLSSAVHNGEAVEQPCPVCRNDPTPRDGVKGGTCKDGVRNGLACDVGGTSDFFGSLSIDCQPASNKGVGVLSIGFKPATTGTTQLASNRPCADAAGQTCFCDTCATSAAEPCNVNADCPVGIICGGRRCISGSNRGAPCTQASQCPGGFCNKPGQPSRPNACADGLCTLNAADGPTEGVCEGGPVDQHCSLETYRGCVNNADCNPSPTGTCPSCTAGQSCESSNRQCFLDPIVRHGVADTQNPVVAATFCIPPTTSQSVNQVAGLPGPGSLELPTRVFKLGANCGNNTIDAGEACDGSAGGACPGACQLDCQCPGCGNGAVDPGEQCDGSEDSACPGQCQPNCQCLAGSCGNNSQEFGEACDGTDDAACPGSCRPNCTCGAVCGNNVVEGTEECDGAGSLNCPAEACQPNCTCGAFCGNNEIDPGEQCDGNGTGACMGTCQSDCQCAPFCGDDIRQGSELCDGTDDDPCPGQCSPACTCPASATITFTVADGADLDTGWTGTAHDLAVQKGSAISGELSNCDGGGDPVCDFFGNVGSACAADPTQACLADNQCTAGGCQINTFGPPLPLSAGGVPACIINRFATDVTGTYNVNTGAAELFTTLSSLVHLGIAVSRPCPICDCGHANCAIGETGTCSDNAGGACRVQGTGPLGPTSNDCFPSPSSNVSGGGLIIPFQPVTTGTSTFPTNQLCDGSGHTSEQCWCDGQPQQNQCAKACDGGGNNNQPCSSDAECPGAPAGACKPLCRQIGPEAVGEGECIAGPPTQTCANAPEIGCQTNSNCPGATGPCQAKNQRCFLDPIVRTGHPDTVQNISVSTFCIPATTASAINQTAGLPGPGAISFPADIDIKRCGDNDVNRFVEECDGTDDSNCPGACLANCTCNATCGNNTIEFGEQCDGTADAACPTQCGAPASANPCVCPANCGDHFVGPGEECDPPNDSRCPGQCSSCQCPVPTATCLNSVLDPGEPCEVPAIGCGPSQACLLCQQCFPDLSPIINQLGFICGNQIQEPTEACELPAIGCGAGQLCNNCTSCVDFIPLCGNENIEPGEACELPAIGCGPHQLCALCNQCIDVPFSICGNLNIEPGEVCELPQQGCGTLSICALCTQCVPLL
jgi:hypothetical protein